MKIQIAERSYDVAALGKLSLFDLLELKKQTGLTVDDLQEQLEGAAEDPQRLIGSAEGITALGALIWLTRRKAGEILTFEQACDFPLEELKLLDDDDVPMTPEGESAPDPQ